MCNPHSLHDLHHLPQPAIESLCCVGVGGEHQQFVGPLHYLRTNGRARQMVVCVGPPIRCKEVFGQEGVDGPFSSSIIDLLSTRAVRLCLSHGIRC